MTVTDFITVVLILAFVLVLARAGVASANFVYPRITQFVVRMWRRFRP